MPALLLSLVFLFSGVPTISAAHNYISQKNRKKFNEKCWSKNDQATLLGIMNRVIKSPLETVYKNDDYIQTFGCAYEDDDIEQNSIRAVFRAIDQSLRNRGINARDNILGLLQSRPPRPDNLARDYTLYVSLDRASETQKARYEVKILDLEVVPTFESRRSIWTRIITRYAYQEDFKNAPAPIETLTEFVEIMALAEKILETAGKGKFKKVNKLISNTKKPTAHPSNIQELVFGDYISLFSEQSPSLADIPAIYLGKGIYFAQIPKFGSMVLKFGEERLFGLRLDTSFFYRATSLFVNLQYHAPESVLQCLVLRFGNKKPFSNFR